MALEVSDSSESTLTVKAGWRSLGRHDHVGGSHRKVLHWNTVPEWRGRHTEIGCSRLVNISSTVLRFRDKKHIGHIAIGSRGQEC